MESRLDKHDRYLSKLENHIQFSKDASRYSSDRFDILLISLSTSSLVLSIGFVKNIVPDLKCIDTTTLKISWLLFVICLISNLISQVSGYYSHHFDIKVTRNLIREERGRNYKGNQNKYERYCSNLNRVTLWLNGFSLLLLITGIVLLVFFFSNQI